MGFIGLVIAPLVATLILVVGLALWRTRALPPRSAADPPGVRTFVTFAGGRELDGTSGDENPATWGRGLFKTILDQLNAPDLAAGPVDDEDYGASAPVDLDGERHHIHLGYVGDDPEEWLLSVETERRGSPRDSPALRRALVALDAAVRAVPALREVRWHRRESWSTSEVAAWRPSPIEDDDIEE